MIMYMLVMIAGFARLTTTRSAFAVRPLLELRETFVKHSAGFAFTGIAKTIIVTFLD